MAEWQLLKCLSTGVLLRRSVCFQLYADSSAVHTQRRSGGRELFDTVILSIIVIFTYSYLILCDGL